MSKLDTLDPDDLAHNPRATLGSWLRFRYIVEQAYRLHPRPHVFYVAKLAPVTVVTNIRDAIKGCLVFDYPCEIPQTDLAKWFHETSFKAIGANVRIGPRKERTPAALEVETKDDAAGFAFDSLEHNEFMAFALLLSTGRLQGPVRIKNPQPGMSEFRYPNLQVLARPDNSLILL